MSSTTVAHRAVLLFLCGLAYTAAISTTAAGAERVPAERRLPSDVEYFAVIRDVPKFSKHAGSTRTARMFTDPEVNAWVRAQTGGTSPEDVIRSQLDVLPDLMEEWYGIRLTALSNPISGESAIAAMPIERDKGAREWFGKNSVIWLVELGPEAESIANQREWIADWLRDPTAIQTEFEKRGVRCRTITPGKNRPETSQLERLAYFSKDSYLVVTTAPELLSDILDRWDGKRTDTLADDVAFKRILKQTCPEARTAGDEYFWFSRNPSSSATYAPIFLITPSDLGCVLLSRTLADEDSHACARWLGPRGPESAPIVAGAVVVPSVANSDVWRRTAACRIGHGNADPVPPLDNKPTSANSVLSVPAWIRNDVRDVCGFVWNPVADDFEPEESLSNHWSSEPAMRNCRSLLRFRGKRMSSRIRHSLSSTIWLMHAPRKDEGRVQAVLAIEVLEDESLRKAMEELETAEVVSASRNSVGHYKLWEINEKKLGIWRWGYKGRKNLVTIAHGHLIFGETVAALSAVINPEGMLPALTSEPAYKQAMANVPTGCLAVEYSRPPLLAEYCNGWETAGPKDQPMDSSRAPQSVVESFRRNTTSELRFVEVAEGAIRKTFISFPTVR